MEIRRLSYFVRVAEDGSLTKSALLLRIAQPALSRQMRLLEEELGVKLFNRTARGMQLTEEGEQLRGAVAGPLRELELALENARGAAKRQDSTVVIGISQGLAHVLSTPLTLHLDAVFPGSKLCVVEGPTGALADWMARGAVDLALLEEVSRDNRLVDRPLIALPLWLIGAPDSGLEAGRPLAFVKLAALPLIVPSHHLGIKGAIDDAVARTRTALNIRLHADSSQLVCDLVASGMGYGILPKAYVQAELDSGRLCGCPITAPELAITLHLSSRRNARIAKGRIAKLGEAITGFVGARLGAPA